MNARLIAAEFQIDQVVFWLGQPVTVHGIRQELDGSYMYDVRLDEHTYSVPAHKLRF